MTVHLSTKVHQPVDLSVHPTPSLEGWTEPGQWTFAAVISAWHHSPSCEVLVDGNGTACGRPARWRWRFHQCSRGIMCDAHLIDWRRRVAELELPDDCDRCGQTFHSLDEVCTVTPL